MAWFEKVKSYGDNAGVEHEVPGIGKVNFYPNRMRSLSNLRKMSAQISTILSAFFADDSNDCGSSAENFEQVNNSEEQQNEHRVSKHSVDAVSVDVLEFRTKQKADAYDGLIGLLTDECNQMFLAGLFMDSMRDEFPYKKNRSPQEIEEFLDPLDITMLSGILVGWLKGNSKQFGDMGKKFLGLVKGRLAEVGAAQTESTQETETETNGSDSKTPSSPQSDTDSTSTGSKS